MPEATNAVEERARRMLKAAQEELEASGSSRRRMHLALHIMVLEEVLGIPSPFDAED